jgi:uncharacterized membrane protein
MSLRPPGPALGADDRRATTEYMVSYGKSGAFGRFTALEALPLRRGACVVVRTPRGLELGTVLCPSTASHARLLTQGEPGRLVREADAADRTLAAGLAGRARQLLDDGTRLARELSLPLQILDVEMLLEGGRAILQYLGPADADVAPLADALADGDLFVLFENLAVPAASAEDEHHGGCDKPDCGRVGGGGCTSCESGGGCSSCGSGKVDMRAYFAHLRTQMENQRRVPLA